MQIPINGLVVMDDGTKLVSLSWGSQVTVVLPPTGDGVVIMGPTKDLFGIPGVDRITDLTAIELDDDEKSRIEFTLVRCYANFARHVGIII